jgi:hypothetical protein
MSVRRSPSDPLPQLRRGAKTSRYNLAELGAALMGHYPLEALREMAADAAVIGPRFWKKPEPPVSHTLLLE